jgi:hypothetical protein
VYLEPVRAPSVPGTTLGHSHHQTLPQTARLARRPILLVDDALAVVLALRNGARIVVCSTEERLKQKKTPGYTSVFNKTPLFARYIFRLLFVQGILKRRPLYRANIRSLSTEFFEGHYQPDGHTCTLKITGGKRLVEIYQEI